MDLVSHLLCGSVGAKGGDVVIAVRLWIVYEPGYCDAAHPRCIYSIVTLPGAPMSSVTAGARRAVWILLLPLSLTAQARWKATRDAPPSYPDSILINRPAFGALGPDGKI